MTRRDATERKRALILLGPPGSGKTSVADSFPAGRDVAVFQPGRLLRREVEGGTAMGRQAEPFMDAGRLVPTDVVVEMLGRALERTEAATLLFDGFPRRKDQIEPLFQLGRHTGFELAVVIILRLSRALAMKRLTGRRTCSRCGAVYHVHFDPPARPGICDRCGAGLVRRPDDQPDVVNERISAYEHQTRPVIEYFKAHHPRISHEVPGAWPLQRIVDAVTALLEAAHRPRLARGAGRDPVQRGRR